MAKSLSEHLIEIATDKGIQGVIVVGKGEAFCAGGDLKSAFHSGDSPSAFHELATYVHLAVLEIRRMRKPVIAAINGIAAGGGFSLALACDFRIMAKSAVLRQAFTSNGLCIDGGGTFTLARLVGLSRALQIAAFDEPISSNQALAWGLTTRVVDDDRVVEEAITMARALSTISLNSFGWCKHLLNVSLSNNLETQLEQERIAISACAAHPDGEEGIRAFMERRKPIFNT